MAIKERGIYSCRSCGQLVTILHRGGGTVLCCNQPMQEGKVDTEPVKLGETPAVYWSCTNCHYVLQALQPPDVCPSCGQACQFVDVSCYIPECGFSGVDSRLMR